MADRCVSPKRQLLFPVFISGTNRSNSARSGEAWQGRFACAIERILKHEPGLTRAALVATNPPAQAPSNGQLYQRTAWSPETTKSLRTGYEKGWKGKREAVRELLRRHPGWQPHSIWAGQPSSDLFGKARKKSTAFRHLGPKMTTESFLPLAATNAEFIAKPYIDLKMPSLSPRCIGKSSRVQFRGISRRTLAQELHLGTPYNPTPDCSESA